MNLLVSEICEIFTNAVFAYIYCRQVQVPAQHLYLTLTLPNALPLLQAGKCKCRPNTFTLPSLDLTQYLTFITGRRVQVPAQNLTLHFLNLTLPFLNLTQYLTFIAGWQMQVLAKHLTLTLPNT